MVLDDQPLPRSGPFRIHTPKDLLRLTPYLNRLARRQPRLVGRSPWTALSEERSR